MKLDLYQLDAFASKPFEGNPAAVCPLDAWLDDELLQAIATENNLSETAFFVPAETGYHLRWFTPSVEVDLCGHATLATAWVIFNALGDTAQTLHFETRSGQLLVQRENDELAMNFPAKALESLAMKVEVMAALGLSEINELLISDDIVVVINDAQLIESLTPDMQQLKRLPGRGIVVTAKGSDVDFVSRWFGPKVGVEEDPVTGSAHTSLAPYWAKRLGKCELTARQGGARKGELRCVVAGERVVIKGRVAPYMKGVITLPSNSLA
ncbi:PhzF family phenazine biosynthesis protein [Halomonas sp. ATBC28]|uniref:PhzF family phenazine biosynthesis protein n=1 Tax=Halomonadaceae TaxID=28256 RepID=UPI000489CF62|nr:MULTISPECIES: PhzF family phenazine biosynthesis protein [unclassified Halomonas]NAO96183.1 PhzF family phenazine biosynthesis isomerase [Halomonas sp. MG34]PKH58625.1 PhzF family phenazine biosynthesis protein [Halomonas sp. Choline-3u-9]QGQ69502.1 PhzF family phenazine biosynthesis protein [Halomonas sp. PA16-9]TMU17753.1 PhzF family phenazine biosynthesis protein [Halomonas sp. ATBC28]